MTCDLRALRASVVLHSHDDIIGALLALASTLEVDLVNAKNADGSTPLHWAARKNHADTIRMLLEHGAAASVANKWGATALDNALYAPMGAYQAIAILSQDSDQVQEALQEARIQQTIRPTPNEIRKRDEEALQTTGIRREDDKARLAFLRGARRDGWLGWHNNKQDPELIVPEKRMLNADAALAQALAPRGRTGGGDGGNGIAPPPPSTLPPPRPVPSSSPSQFMSSPTARPLVDASPQPSASPAPNLRAWLGYNAPVASLQDHGGGRTWLGYTAAEHAELIRALDEATAAGNHTCGIGVLESRVSDARRVLRLLKLDDRRPSPPRSTEGSPTPRAARSPEQDTEKEVAIDQAVHAARERARSPPASYKVLHPKWFETHDVNGNAISEMALERRARCRTSSPRRATATTSDDALVASSGSTKSGGSLAKVGYRSSPRSQASTSKRSGASLYTGASTSDPTPGGATLGSGGTSATSQPRRARAKTGARSKATASGKKLDFFGAGAS